MQQQTIEVALTRPHEPWKPASYLRAQKLNEVRFRRLADAQMLTAGAYLAGFGVVAKDWNQLGWS